MGRLSMGKSKGMARLSIGMTKFTKVRLKMIKGMVLEVLNMIVIKSFSDGLLTDKSKESV